MIQTPRRSVTRFFIPLIDVLLLLFCIFLLMPLARESDLERAQDSLIEQGESTEVLERELDRRTRELRKFESLRASLDQVDKLKQEIERLRAASKQAVQQRTSFHVIDIDGATGGISFYDASNAQQPVLKISDARTAELLIQRHQRESRGKELYYYFLFPRQETGYPTTEQENAYRDWFKSAAHSLKGGQQ